MSVAFAWKTWRCPTLPRLKTQYHRRRGVSRPSSGWDRVFRPRHGHQVIEANVFLEDRVSSGLRPARRSGPAGRRRGRAGILRIRARSGRIATGAHRSSGFCPSRGFGLTGRPDALEPGAFAVVFLIAGLAEDGDRLMMR